MNIDRKVPSSAGRAAVATFLVTFSFSSYAQDRFGTMQPQGIMLMNRLGPSMSELYIANSDGSGERKLSSGSDFEYNARFSADGEWVVFTSERDDDYPVGNGDTNGDGDDSVPIPGDWGGPPVELGHVLRGLLDEYPSLRDFRRSLYDHLADDHDSRYREVFQLDRPRLGRSFLTDLMDYHHANPTQPPAQVPEPGTGLLLAGGLLALSLRRRGARR